MLRRSLPVLAFTPSIVGKTQSGFSCLRVEPSLSDLADPEGNPMQGTLWIHEKSQTQVFFFSAKARQEQQENNNNNNTVVNPETSSTSSGLAGEKACCITFCTPPENDSGATHILEHTVLCGSEKFPTVRDPFFKMLRRSLSTFMNAMTSPDATFFPFSTVNEQDFFNILDVYLDCTLHPLIRPLDFAQEAHRLKVVNNTSSEMEESHNNNNIERTGVVLNEMKGALSDPMTWFQTCLAKHVHQDSTYALCFGGAPPAIPELKHEDLVKYYGKHYQRPIVALYDSSITSAEEKLKFLDKTLQKILTEVEKPRAVLANNDNSNNASAENVSDVTTPLEMLSNLRQQQRKEKSSENSNNKNNKFALMYGPPDPVSSSLEAEKGISTARLGCYFPLSSLISNKILATRENHKKLFALQLLLHISLRPPSGPLYKALVLNAENTKALQSVNLIDVQERSQKLLQELSTATSETASPIFGSNKTRHDETQESEQQQQQQSSTIDLIPGSGLDISTQTPALFFGLQNVPVCVSSTSAKDGDDDNNNNNHNATNDLTEAKTQLLSTIIACAFSDIKLHGIDQDLVESALHEFELSLRVRDRQSAVNATISSTSGVIRGLDPFFAHIATDLDKEISADILSSVHVEEGMKAANNKYFSKLIEDEIVSGSSLFNNNNNNNTSSKPSIDDEKFIAVVASSKFVEKQAEEEKVALEQLRQTISSEQVQSAKKLDADLLEAQKRVDDGGSLPTLKVSDISPNPINFTSATINENQIKTFVTNTAGLVYVRFQFPLAETLFSDSSFSALLLPLFVQLFSSLGHINKSVAEQDIAIRKACSGFSAGINIATVPSKNIEDDHVKGFRPNLRAVEIGFHCMPQNLERSLELLTECIESNCCGLWSEKIPQDPERKAMLFQLITMTASDLESRITHEGTRFATSEALGFAISGNSHNHENETVGVVADPDFNSCTLNRYQQWGGLSLVRQFSQLKEQIAELSSNGQDPTEAVSMLFAPLENIARQLFMSNPHATSYIICGPKDHDAAKTSVVDKFMKKIASNTESQIDNINNNKTLIKEDDTSLFSIVTKTSEQNPSYLATPKTIELPNSDGSAFVGCVLPTTLHLRHELAPAFRLALQIASAELLHREIREIGGAYGSSARLGVGDLGGTTGICSFGSYRDPTPERTIDIFKNGSIYDWVLGKKTTTSGVTQRMLDEAKLSIFGAIDAPMAPHEAGSRVAVQQFDQQMFADYRKKLLDVTLDDVVRSVEEHLKPEATQKMMSICVLGSGSKK